MKFYVTKPRSYASQPPSGIEIDPAFQAILISGKYAVRLDVQAGEKFPDGEGETPERKQFVIDALRRLAGELGS